jgi:peptidoglycan/xylan/chitin deacetylase (PgdA/CDA1 family)
MHVFISHDVDWPKQGPGARHILARKERFDEEIIGRVVREDFNPYYGIPRILEIEETVGVRSTFFFRPLYDDGITIAAAYKDDLKELKNGHWEVGAHINQASSLRSIAEEKRTIEKLLGSEIMGSRVHYLRIRQDDLPLLRKAGFLYDSSLVFSKDKVDVRNTGYSNLKGLIEFPITFMDAYLFTYLGLTEEKVVQFVMSSLGEFMQQSSVKLVTILWHDNAILMRGGRAYSTLLENLVSLKSVKVIRGIDAYNMSLRGELNQTAQ